MTDVLRLNHPALRWAAVLPLLLAAFVWATAAQARSAPDSFADLVEKLLPSVVNISTSQVVESTEGSEEFERRGERPQRQNSLGSGFIIDAGGYIVTNHHVIAEADEISVRLRDGTTPWWSAATKRQTWRC